MSKEFFQVDELARWDAWLQKNRAKLTYQLDKLEGAERRRYYKINQPRGDWVFYLTERNMTSGEVAIWADDGLRVVTPDNPGWDGLRSAKKICTRCGKVGGGLSRAGFAGRWCDECREKHISEVEYPGWTE